MAFLRGASLQLFKITAPWLGFSLIALLSWGGLSMGCSHTLAEEKMQKDTTALAMQAQLLKDKLKKVRSVRILIKLKENSGGSPGSIDMPSPSLLQRQTQFLEKMQGEGVTSGKVLKGTPLILMNGTKEGLERLLQTQMVDTIQEDQPQKPFGVK